MIFKNSTLQVLASPSVSLRGPAAPNSLHTLQLPTRHCHVLRAPISRVQPGSSCLAADPCMAHRTQRNRHRVQRLEATAQEGTVRALAAHHSQRAIGKEAHSARA